MADQDVAPVSQDQAINQALVQGADVAIALKVEHTKLPEIWGNRTKDSIKSIEFINRINNMVKANNWSEKVAFCNFSMVLRGSASIWLESQVTLEVIEDDTERWSIIKSFFKAEFAVETHDKLILDGLAHLEMKSNENVGDYFGHLNKIMNIIYDAYEACTSKPEEPTRDNNDIELLWSR
jgi:hypothetical protein